MRHTISLLLLLAWLPITQVSAQSIAICDKLNRAIKPYIDSGMLSGNLALAKKGKVVCQISVGFADSEQQPMKPDAAFSIASLSKPIVASLVLRLEELGKLATSDTLDKHLPHFDAPWASQVTLHHLLSNRSGLANHFMLPGWGTEKYQRTVPHASLLNEIAAMELAFTPGTQYRYSNLGWLLLGEVIEAATSKSIQRNLNEHIFAPNDMTRSGLIYQSTPSLVSEFRWGAKGGWQAEPSLHMQVFNVGGGIYSTSGDIVRYLDVLHRGSLLSETSKTKLFAADSPYGWRIEQFALTSGEQKNVHSFDGQLKGYSSFVYHVLEDDLSLVLLTNTGMGFEHKRKLADDVLDAYYSEPSDDIRDLPSLQLNRSLLDNGWDTAVSALTQTPLTDVYHAILVNDLAQQLNWSGNETKAIDLYLWLVASFPENERLKQRLEQACQRQSHYAKCRQTSAVGMQVLPLKDSARQAWRSNAPRPMLTHLFYPTLDTDVQPLMLGPIDAPLFNAGNVVHNAQPLSERRPLILLSHGTGGSAPQLLWLAHALVNEGYVVAAVNHHGNTAIEAEKLPEGFLLWWERAQDLRAVQTQLLQSAKWGDKIDKERIAVVGFSLGGYTTIATLGGITNKASFNEYCRHADDDFSCQPQPEFLTVLEAFDAVKSSPQVMASQQRQHQDFSLPNIKAGVAIAPAILHAFEPQSLAAIDTPTLFIVGSEDQIAPTAPNSAYANALLPNSRLHTIEYASHYSFLSNCTELGRQRLSELCVNHTEVSRENIHQQAIAYVVGFLKAHL